MRSVALIALTFILSCAVVRAQQPPVPQPFPQPGRPQAARPAPATPAPATAPSTPAPQAPSGSPVACTPGTPLTEAALGVPLYPGAQFLNSYDAGRGQRFCLFGSAASFVDLATWYRTVLKQKGELIFDAPATLEFDVGRFREDTMTFPPGVTIKEYKSEISEGYPNPKPGGQPARFPTVIQIVPATEK